ncbi:hypothetical protein RCL1_004218 [Eukaryota sp. TZLM3-RCL]
MISSSNCGICKTSSTSLDACRCCDTLLCLDHCCFIQSLGTHCFSCYHKIISPAVAVRDFSSSFFSHRTTLFSYFTPKLERTLSSLTQIASNLIRGASFHDSIRVLRWNDFPTSTCFLCYHLAPPLSNCPSCGQLLCSSCLVKYSLTNFQVDFVINICKPCANLVTCHFELEKTKSLIDIHDMLTLLYKELLGSLSRKSRDLNDIRSKFSQLQSEFLKLSREKNDLLKTNYIVFSNCHKYWFKKLTDLTPKISKLLQ